VKESCVKIRAQLDALAQEALLANNGADLVSELVASLATLLAMAPLDKRANTRSLIEELIATMFDAADNIGRD
jgi:hypothetical protein